MVCPLANLTIYISHALIAVALQPLNQPSFTLNNKSATVITQHNMQLCSDFQIQENTIPLGSSVASTNFNVRKTQKIAATCKSKSGYIRLLMYRSALTLLLSLSNICSLMIFFLLVNFLFEYL